MDKIKIMSDITAPITDIDSLIKVIEARINYNLHTLQQIAMSISDESNKKRVQMVHENALLHELLSQIKNAGADIV